MRLAPQGRDYICDVSPPALFEDRSLYPCGICNNSGESHKPTNTIEERILIHILWRGEVNPSLYATLDSLLVTQNMSKVQIRLWVSDVELDHHEAVVRMNFSNHEPIIDENTRWWKSLQQLKHRYEFILRADYMKINTTSWREIVMTSYLHEQHPTWDFDSIPVKHTASISDIVRLVILHDYGGIYLDEDVLTARDLSPYVESQCEWMAAQYNHHFNNHFIVLKENGKTVKFLLNAIALFPWNRPDTWPAWPLTNQTAWVYNDALTQYCIQHPETCRLSRLPMFLVDHHMHHLCTRIVFEHYPGCQDSRRKNMNGLQLMEDPTVDAFDLEQPMKQRTIRTLLMSLRLSTLHRHVPHKGKCSYDTYSLSTPIWENPDSVLFYLIKEFVQCRDDSSKVCLNEQEKLAPRSLHSLLVQTFL
jgi:hypothetical protein